MQRHGIGEQRSPCTPYILLHRSDFKISEKLVFFFCYSALQRQHDFSKPFSSKIVFLFVILIIFCRNFADIFRIWKHLEISRFNFFKICVFSLQSPKPNKLFMINLVFHSPPSWGRARYAEQQLARKHLARVIYLPNQQEVPRASWDGPFSTWTCRSRKHVEDWSVSRYQRCP